MRSRFERGERALCTRLPFDDTQMTRGVNEANTRRKRGGHAVKTREKRVHARVPRSVSLNAFLAGVPVCSHGYFTIAHALWVVEGVAHHASACVYRDNLLNLYLPVT